MPKILVIAPSPTHPTFSGNRFCILSYIELLKKEGFEIYYLWVAYHNCTEEEVNLTKKYWGDRLFIFKKGIFNRIKDAFFKWFRFNRTFYYNVDDLYPIGLDRKILKLRKTIGFDSVIVNYVFLSRAARMFQNENLILYTHDVFTNKFQLTSSKWFSLRPNEESKGINRFETILSIQENETIFLRFLTKKKVITSYCYFQVHPTEYKGNNDLLFFSGDNEYNLEAINWFIENVFFRLKNIIETRLIIGGKICDKLTHLHDNSIVLYGKVNDPNEFYSLGDIVINPTFNGTGLKIKTFEAMAYGKALVCHPHNVIGIFNQEAAPIQLAANEDDYVKIILKLLDDRDLIKELKDKSIEYIMNLNIKVKSSFLAALLFK